MNVFSYLAIEARSEPTHIFSLLLWHDQDAGLKTAAFPHDLILLTGDDCSCRPNIESRQEIS